ncbi:MAG: DUF4349 domain-containing protein [Bacillus sp. (in: firmicutes)]
MKWRYYLGICFLLVLLLAGCSAENDLKEYATTGESSNSANELAVSDDKESAKQDETESGTEERSQSASDPERMIVYTADMSLSVEDANKFVGLIEKDVTAKKGFIVSKEQSVNGDGEISGVLTVRIPQASFQSFLDMVGKEKNITIDHQSVSGEDVTNEYVDLTARLEAREAVEKRLYEFMGKASKTEDLLKISEDLGEVQTEIEQLKGQMNYLSNQSSMSTVNIHYTENGEKWRSTGDFRTWDQIKQAFIQSLHMLWAFGSSTLVFLIGYLPIWIPLGLAGFLIWYFIRRSQKRRKKEE